MSSDWSSFAALDDDEDVSGGLDARMLIDRTEYAREEDTQERKRVVGATLDPPIILRPADPIRVPAGKKFESMMDHDVSLAYGV
jgi:hypothetical protein